MEDLIKCKYDDGTIYYKIEVSDDLHNNSFLPMSNEEYKLYIIERLNNRISDIVGLNFLKFFEENKYNAFYECDFEKCPFSRINSDIRNDIETNISNFIEHNGKEKFIMISVFGQNMLSEFFALRNIKKKFPTLNELDLHAYNPGGYMLFHMKEKDSIAYEAYKTRWSIFKYYLKNIGFQTINIYEHSKVPQLKCDLIYAMDHTNPKFYPTPYYLKELYDTCIKSGTVIVNASLDHVSKFISVFIVRIGDNAIIDKKIKYNKCKFNPIKYFKNISLNKVYSPEINIKQINKNIENTIKIILNKK